MHSKNSVKEIVVSFLTKSAKKRWPVANIARARRHHKNPFAIILACSDSRVPTELIFDRGIGELFVIRVAGNIVAPSQIGSIEFAAEAIWHAPGGRSGPQQLWSDHRNIAGTRLKESHRSPNLRAIVDRIRPAVEPVLQSTVISTTSCLRCCIRANIQASVEHLRHGSVILEQLIDSGRS